MIEVLKQTNQSGTKLNSEKLTKPLNLDFYITDHSPDKAETGEQEALEELYENIKKDGINSVRYDWRWAKTEPQQGVYDDEAIIRYGQAIEIMKKVGLQPPTIVLSEVPAWALELYKTNKEKFFDAYRHYLENVRINLSRISTETGEFVSRIQILNELNNTVYTPIKSEDIPTICTITREVLSSYNSNIKLMGTIFAGNLPEVAKKVSLGKIDLVIPAEEYLDKHQEILDALDIIAVDYYPGMWHIPMAEAIGNGKSMFEQLDLLQKIMEKLASLSKEYELGEIGIQTNIPLMSREYNENRQRYFYDVFFRAFKKMLLNFQERGLALPTRVGLYQAIDQPATTLSGKILRKVTPFPENDMGQRNSDGSPKEILRGKRHRVGGEDRGPSQLSEIIRYMNTPVRKSKQEKNEDALV